MVSDVTAGRAAGDRTQPAFDVIQALVSHVVRVGIRRYVNEAQMPAFILEASLVQDRARAAIICGGQDRPLEQMDLVLAAQALILDAALVAIPKEQERNLMLGIGRFHRLTLTERAKRIASARGNTSGKHWLDTQRRGEIQGIARAIYTAVFYPDEFVGELAEAREIAGLNEASGNN